MIAFDWDHSKVTIYDGATVRTYPTLNDLLDDLNGPILLVGETSFESFDLSRRAAFKQRCEEEGHVLRATPPRMTRKYRAKHGLKKSDATDAQAIYGLAMGAIAPGGPGLITPAVEPDPEYLERATAARREIMQLRREPGGKKAALGKSILKWLKNQPGYNEYGVLITEGVAASISIAAKYARSRREFEKIVGLSANGFPNQFRSDVLWFGDRRRRTLGETKSRYRKAIRWLYHQLKGAGKLDSATGKIHPCPELVPA